jgi:hypothetical protein
MRKKNAIIYIKRRGTFYKADYYKRKPSDSSGYKYTVGDKCNRRRSYTTYSALT